MSFRLKQIAEEIGAELHGDPDCEIVALATLGNAGPGTLSFLSSPRYRKFLKTTRAAAVILTAASRSECPVAALVCRDPYLAYAKVAHLFGPSRATEQGGIHPSAVIDPAARVHVDASIGPHCVVEAGAVVGERVRLGAFCFLGHDVEIGTDGWLAARVTLYPGVRIGARVVIHSGAVIGSDGFGFANDRGRWVKIPQLGTVTIGEDVEIGANTTIDRGALDDTVIEDGVKLDNLVQIGHNVRVGAHTVIAGCAGIAGSTRIGRHCAIGGAAGVRGHLEIADHVVINGMSRVNKSIPVAGEYSSGTLLDTNEQWLKNAARYRHLDALARRLAALEKKVGSSS